MITTTTTTTATTTIIIMLSFRAGTSKNKKHRSARYVWKRPHLFTPPDLTLSNVLNSRFNLFYCNRKEKDHIRRKISGENKNID